MKTVSFAMVLLGLTVGPCDLDSRTPYGCNGGGGPTASEYSTPISSGLNIIGQWNVTLWYVNGCPETPNPLYSFGTFQVSTIADTIRATLVTDSTGIVEMKGIRNDNSFSFFSGDLTFLLDFTMITDHVGEGTLTTPTTYRPRCRPSTPVGTFFYDMRR